MNLMLIAMSVFTVHHVLRLSGLNINREKSTFVPIAIPEGLIPVILAIVAPPTITIIDQISRVIVIDKEIKENWLLISQY